MCQQCHAVCGNLGGKYANQAEDTQLRIGEQAAVNIDLDTQAYEADFLEHTCEDGVEQMCPLVDEIVNSDCGQQTEILSGSFCHCIAFLREACYNVSKELIRRKNMDFLFRLLPPARWRILCMTLLVVALMCCVSSYLEGSRVYENVAAVCLALAIGGTLGFWRCPRCRRILPLKNMMYLKECPKCRTDVRNYKY